jgi:hypothetical protein
MAVRKIKIKEFGKFMGNFLLFLYQQGINKDKLIKRLK